MKIEFAYQARDMRGRRVTGCLSAPNAHVARQMLLAQGLEPVALTPSDQTATKRKAEGRSDGAPVVRSRERRGRRPFADEMVLALTRELAGLIHAEVPLDRAFRLLQGLFPKPPLSAMIETVTQALRQGESLSQALAPFETELGPLYLAMVRAGEATGNLASALDAIVRHLERRIATRKALVSALIYPAILLTVSVLSLALILGFVVPQFRELFDDLGEGLPLLTQWVVALGDIVRAQAHWLFAGLFALLAAFEAWRQTPHGRSTWDRWVLGLPLIGAIVRQTILARYLRTLGTLLKQGVSLLQAAKIAHGTLRNAALESALSGVSEVLKRGGRLSAALQQALPEEVYIHQVVRLGEETGRLAKALEDTGSRLDEWAETRTKRALQLVEPLIIVTLGALVALIIMAVLLGILSVNQLV